MEEPMSTNEDNDSLHIAARSGKKEKMLKILGRRPTLIYHQNMRGDTPLHIAAEAGHLGVVELLISFFQSLRSSQSSGSTENRAEEIPSVRNDETRIEIQEDGTDTITNSLQPPQSSQSGSTGNIEIIEAIWKIRNHDGNTALHEALRNEHEDIALHLLDVDSEPVEFANKNNESPLYLAAKAGFVRVLHKILEVGREPSTLGPKGQTPFHAAVFAKSEGSIEGLYGSIPALINIKDSAGKTALYYATQEDSLEIIRQLLELDASALERDNEGLSPLLVAVKKGRSASIAAILNACPAPIDSSDDNGRNALHLAVIHNTIERFKTSLSFPKIKALANKGDREGNTPLHLAIMTQKYQHAQALLHLTKVKLKAKNNAEQTVFDLCPSDKNLSDEQRQIRDALAKAALDNASKFNFLRRYLSTGPLLDDQKLLALLPEKRLSEVINGLSVVATLIAAATFAAVLQIPGGYNSDDGSPLLIDHTGFKVFVLADALALCLSLLALHKLMSPSVKNASVANIKAVRNCVIILRFALLFAVMAFFYGINLVILKKCRWLGALLTVISGFTTFQILLTNKPIYF